MEERSADCVSKLSYIDTREAMVLVARNMWERRLTNAAGGNFAVQVDENRVLFTPSLMAERRFCILKPEDLLLSDWNLDILEGEGKLSRESVMHVKLLQNFKNIGATIHAHPFYCMPFVAYGKKIPSVTEATTNRGDVECIDYTKAYTPELADNVYKYFDERRELAEKKPIAVILPGHGVVVSGLDLFTAYSMLERIECDAFCTLARSLL
jgi:L-fuculose-phosphate aldolase